MKQQHQMKIKSMQKFVPFLSKLLERLKTESGNESKIVQMQLFLDLLICPDASVTIEELDKCEHELSGLYESYEGDALDALPEFQASCEAVKVEEVSSQESTAMRTKQDDEHPSQDVPVNQVPCESVQVDKPKLREERSIEKEDISENQINVPVKESSKVVKADVAIADQHSREREETKDNSQKEMKKGTYDEENKNLVISKDEAKIDENKNNEREEYVEDEPRSTAIKDLSNEDRNTNNSNHSASLESDVEVAGAANGGDSDNGEAVDVPSEDSDDGEIEENVEIVKYPEVESEEMILPDSAEEETNSINRNEEDIPAETEEKNECQVEPNDDEDPTAEPELIAFASGSDSKDDEKNDNNDPLNVEESVSKTNEMTTNPDAATADDDDDDDVQVIEMRNSPICVDSDDDSDPQVIIKANESTTQNPPKKVENLEPQTTKKSKPTPIPQKRTKSLPKGSSVIDTIDLLDSSDEEKPQYSKPAMISPIKRCLLPKPIRQSKRKRSPSIPTTSLRPQNRSAPKPPTQLHISTPQSNFLNAVNLQPANTANPPAFSAQLLNKNVIIPNAFYGNPPDVRSKAKSNKTIQAFIKSPATPSTEVTAQQEKMYRRWLDNFLINFASPLQIVSHSCFVLLQRVLKHKFFQKVKEARTNLNDMAQRQLTNETPASLDIQLMLDLRNTLFNSEAQLSEIGIKFCEFASTQSFSKSVPLTTDIKSGRVTSRTRVDDSSSTQSSLIAAQNKNLNGLPKSTLNQANGYTKKGKKDDTDEYTPNKPVIIAGEGNDSVHCERKRSLRRNRSKRYDNNFSYNEDQNDDEEEEEEEDSYAAIARKIEQKRREAQQKREKMAKSFESAFIEAFSKQIDGATKRQKLGAVNESQNEYKEVFSNTPAYLEVGMRCGEGSVVMNVDIDGDQYEDADSLDDGPREHRIYKVTPTAPYKPPKRQSTRTPKTAPTLASEVITCSDGSDDNEDYKRSSVDLASAPKNTNRSMFMTSKNNEIVNSFCIICRRQVQRIVHHYVNEHRGCEVYTSRLSGVQLTQLRRKNGNLAQMSPYKNGQNQYEATCPFCQKRSRFMLSYWYQHFTMHTGEYSYRCGGCGTRKPTRSLLLAHLKTPCRKGATVCQDFTFEAKSNQIEARVCTLCNYIQLHRSNVVQHLRTQHGLRDILPKHIQSVVLLKIPATTPTAPTTQTSTIHELSELDSASSCSKQPDNSNNNLKKFFDNFEDVSAAQFNYDDDDPSDDLSFMICGMLDVQMNTD